MRAGCAVSQAGLRTAPLLTARLARWLQIKSRAGAVYVTWGRASEALQQLTGDFACWFESPSRTVTHLPVRLQQGLFLSVLLLLRDDRNVGVKISPHGPNRNS